MHIVGLDIHKQDPVAESCMGGDWELMEIAHNKLKDLCDRS
jgi:hypothetical protein